MRNNFPKIPLLLSTTFFVFSCFIFFFFYNQIKNNEKQLQSKESQWQTEASRRDEIKALDRSVKMIAEERQQLETHFAQSSDIVPFLDTIDKLSREAGSQAEVTSVNIADSGILAIGMKASGSFGSLYKFLTLLENSPYELEFTGVDLHRETIIPVSSESVAAPKWNATFKANLLSFIN